MDYKKMHDRLDMELEGIFKGNMTPEKVSIIDDITTAMRNLKKMEYWEGPHGEAERKYMQDKHEGKHVATVEHKEEYKEPYEERGEIYGFYDDMKEYMAAKEHYRRCREHGDHAAMATWKEVALGNLRSSMAQLDMGIQAKIGRAHV